MTAQQLVSIFLIVSTTFHEVTCQSENIALNKSTEQTPGTFQEHYSGLAVDGNDDNNAERESCSHTSGSYWNTDVRASWKVSLGGLFHVIGIVIVNRDKEQERLQNFLIYGSTDHRFYANEEQDKTRRQIYNDRYKNTFSNAIIHIPLNGSISYSKIVIELPNHDGDPDGGVSYLTLCEVKIYAAPPKCSAYKAQVPNGGVQIDENTGILVNQQYTVGTVLKVKCDGSFHLNGSPFVKCLSTGEYNYSTFPNCLEVCPRFLKPIFASEVQPDLHFYRVGAAVSVICEYGYKTVSKNQIICLSGGIWDSSIPTCHPIKCQKPKNPDNGHYIIVKASSVPYNNSDLGTEINVECKTGYENVNVRNRVCQSDRTWSGQEAICILVLCKHPGNIANGAYIFENGSEIGKDDKTKFSYNTSLKTSCFEGYTLRGKAHRTCKSDKTWSGIEPYCDVVTCKFPGLYENGNYARNKNMTENGTNRSYLSGHINFSTEIEAICVEGYILNSTDFIRRCTSNGLWTGENPVCAQVFCRWPLTIKSGYYKASRNETNIGMPYNTTLTAFCIGNYKLREEYKTRRCNGSAVWDEEPAICMSVQESQTSVNIVTIVCVSAAVVIALALATGSVIFLKQRRKGTRKESELSMTYTDLQERQDRSPHNITYTDLQLPDHDYATILEKQPCSGNASIDEIPNPASQHWPVYCNTVIEQVP